MLMTSDIYFILYLSFFYHRVLAKVQHKSVAMTFYLSSRVLNTLYVISMDKYNERDDINPMTAIPYVSAFPPLLTIIPW